MESWREVACPIQRTAMLFADVYIIMILRDLATGEKRFTELQQAGINPRILSQRLKMLTREGAISRTRYAEKPPRVEYALTPKGLALMPILDALKTFGEQYLPLDDNASSSSPS
ncbi:winged helix-turn-helix transcriptional regulator [Sulfobacillus thermosulfidooxidans]|uniref:winged helix-turn-helix transcriptional regulator n=1 Tax=Sulfobacillus thermosulfidooxidans TaxID=28034 RepID=UPI0006B59513|nr:helix-turn-helix domain-containing protein [Sulfobacillus thermosulfidooxidans]